MKQKKKALSLYEGYETSIAAESLEERDELEAKFQAMEENCFDLGEDDRGAHFPKWNIAILQSVLKKRASRRKSKWKLRGLVMQRTLTGTREKHSKGISLANCGRAAKMGSKNTTSVSKAIRTG